MPSEFFLNLWSVLAILRGLKDSRVLLVTDQCSRIGFLNPDGHVGPTILCVGNCLGYYCRMFRSIPGLYPLDASRTHSCLQSKMSLDIANCPLEDKTTPG